MITKMKSLVEVEQHINRHRAHTKMFRRFMARSSVAVILRQGNKGVEVLLIKRADREGDRWSGHMAFPGGRSQKEDDTARKTALRETFEEIGLALTSKHYIGRLSDVMTLAHGSKRPMVVSPYAFRVAKVNKLVLNDEVAEVVWVPLNFFSESRNRSSMAWKQKGLSLTLPCYFFQGHRIWG